MKDLNLQAYKAQLTQNLKLTDLQKYNEDSRLKIIIFKYIFNLVLYPNIAGLNIK